MMYHTPISEFCQDEQLRQPQGKHVSCSTKIVWKIWLNRVYENVTQMLTINIEFVYFTIHKI